MISAALLLVLAAEPSVLRLGPPVRAKVERVVTLAPSLTDTVLQLGRGATLVGVSRFDEDPAVATLPRVGGFIDPSVETVVSLKPHLVVVQMSPGNRQAVEKMASLGISVIALPMTSTREVLEAVTVLGAALGAAEKASELVSAIEAVRSRVREAARGRQGPAPRVMLVYGFKPLVVAGPGSFAHELLLDVGAENVAGKAPNAYPVFSLERAVALQPDVVIDCSDSPDGRVETRALVSKPRWVQPKSRALLQPGPSLGAGLLELQAAVLGR
ncbi:MAG: ABC transporter substrate-binding protein [Myxococcaceae bacterium]|nr:ABC transporter substrate-binding protein [Myxococcaceae bacterium]